MWIAKYVKCSSRSSSRSSAKSRIRKQITKINNVLEQRLETKGVGCEAAVGKNQRPRR